MILRNYYFVRSDNELGLSRKMFLFGNVSVIYYCSQLLYPFFLGNNYISSPLLPSCPATCRNSFRRSLFSHPIGIMLVFGQWNISRSDMGLTHTFSSRSIMHVFRLDTHLWIWRSLGKAVLEFLWVPIMGSAHVACCQRGSNVWDPVIWHCRLTSKVRYTWGQSRDSEW